MVAESVGPDSESPAEEEGVEAETFLLGSQHDSQPGKDFSNETEPPQTEPPQTESAGDEQPDDQTIVGTPADNFFPGMKVPLNSVPQIFGRYRIIDSLGQGAMGYVYLAQDTTLDRQVALKFPKVGEGDDEVHMERFYREARAAASLNHRNLCPVYDVGMIDNIHFISMFFVEGQMLSVSIEEGVFSSQQRAATTIRKLAEGLREAHRNNVIHRDLKPANIMIDRQGEPMVMDFGLARQIDAEDSRLTKTGTIIGSPAYMSPEQANSQKDAIGAASDIYSLGVIFYELLSGQRPFRGSVIAVLTQILRDEPRRPSELREDVDSQLESICMKMMQKSIDERFSSMDQIVDALNVYLGEQSVSASSATGVAAGEHDEYRSYSQGDTVDGQYLIERRIKGGMSFIYIVTDRVTEKRYVLKALDEDRNRSDIENRKARFEREAAVWVNLDHHPYIVQAFTLLQRSEPPMLLLEYVDGPSLADVLSQHGRLSMQQAVRWASQFCSGMQYVHTKQLPGGQQGILHRDIKPGNILFDRNGTLKVTDFGLAKLNDGRVKSVSGEFVGTLSYASPEQLRNAKHIDRRAEIFSFGIVFYEMLTGVLPFPAEDIAEVIQSIQFREPVWDAVPQLLLPVVQRCLQKSPGPRFESFDALAAALSQIEPRLPSSADEMICPSCGFVGVRNPSCIICDEPTTENEVTQRHALREPEPMRAPPSTDRFASTVVLRCPCGAVLESGSENCRLCGREHDQLQCAGCRTWNLSINAFCNYCGCRLGDDANT